MERFHSISPEISTSAYGWRKTLRTRGLMLNRDDKSSSLLTSSLPTPMFSKEMEMRSPKNSIPFSSRKTLRTRGSMLNREDKSSLLTASLPAPMFSKEMGMRSPKNSTPSSLKKTLRSHDCLLTSSLPSSVLSKVLDMKSPKNITSQVPHNEVIEGVDYRHRYPIYEGLPHLIMERPKSASIHLNHAELQVIKRKPLWNFTRVRPCSTKLGRIRFDSPSEFNAGTCQVDDAFTNIKYQLAQLSEEDVLLQERLECLTLEIASMQRCVDGICYLPAVAPTTACVTHGQGEILTTPNLSSPSASVLTLSPSQSNIQATEESWEDKVKDWEGSKESGGGKGISNYLNLSDSAQDCCEQSLGSCESRTYSDGSLSFGQPSCRSVVMI